MVIKLLCTWICVDICLYSSWVEIGSEILIIDGVCLISFLKYHVTTYNLTKKKVLTILHLFWTIIKSTNSSYFLLVFFFVCFVLLCFFSFISNLMIVGLYNSGKLRFLSLCFYGCVLHIIDKNLAQKNRNVLMSFWEILQFHVWFYGPGLFLLFLLCFYSFLYYWRQTKTLSYITPAPYHWHPQSSVVNIKLIFVQWEVWGRSFWFCFVYNCQSFSQLCLY